MLTSGIEQAKRIRVVTNHDGDGVVVEHLAQVELAPAGCDGQLLTVGTYSLGNLFVV